MRQTYADTSALVKLLVDEDESAALARALGDTTVTSSIIAAVELVAVVRRRGLAGGEALVAEILTGIRLLPISDAVIQSARAMPSTPPLKALDLLHLATARVLREAGTTTLIAYDRELCDAARAEAFAVLSPE